MTIGILTIEIHLPGARSLKAKRQVMRRLKDRLRSRYNVSVAELPDHADLWQRSGLMVVAVASHRDPLENLFGGLYREAEGLVPGTVIESGREYIEGAESGEADWEDDEP